MFRRTTFESVHIKGVSIQPIPRRGRKEWLLLTAAPILFCMLLVPALGAVAIPAMLPVHLMPYPRSLVRHRGQLRLGPEVRILNASGLPADHFAELQLQRGLWRVDRVRARLRGPNTAHRIVLARLHSPAGRLLMRRAGLRHFPMAAAREGYVLLVNRFEAAVVGDSSAGVFYGVQTLSQLLRPALSRRVHGRLVSRHLALAPCLRIVDWPAMRWRGVQDDISRGPLPRYAELQRIVMRLARLKVNVLSLYFEDTFNYPGLPLAHEPGGAISPREARRLIRFARAYHVTIVPEQESFGHLHLILQYQKYQPLDELPYGDVLSPVAPGSLRLIGRMFHELAAVFPSPFLHIGADETFQLGQGRTRPLVQAEGRGEVFINYVRQIDALLRPYHRRVMFWGDIAVKHPELLSQLPKNMVALPWDYAPRASYDFEIAPFRRAGLPVWVSPGVSNWSRIYPDYSEALPNIRVFIRDGRALGARGVLNTTWMDDGEALFGNAWYGLAYGAAAGWQTHMNNRRFRVDYDWDFFRASGHHFEHEVEALTRIQKLLHQSVGAGAMDWLVWLDAFTRHGQGYYRKMRAVAPQIRLLAEQVYSSVLRHRKQARQNRRLLALTAFSARRLDYLGQKALYARYIVKLYRQAQKNLTVPGRVEDRLYRINGVNGLVQDLRDHNFELRAIYKKLWLRENRPYFLPNILERYNAEARRWSRLARQFSTIQSRYRHTHRLPATILHTRG